MRLHTSGPEQTDSYAAANAYFAGNKIAGQIILHDSFAAIYDHLADLTGDYLIVPAAYQSSEHESWGQLHYRHLTDLTLIDSLVTTLDPLAFC
ncbi:hypothetical protein ACWNPI_08540 [Limosilactobacillus fermentum]